MMSTGICIDAARSNKMGEKNQNNLQIGELVLIQEDNLPPAKWSTTRIVLSHLGQDGIVRGRRSINGSLLSSNWLKVSKETVCSRSRPIFE